MNKLYTRLAYFVLPILALILILMLMQAKGWLAPLEYLLLQAPSPVIKSVNWVITPIKTVTSTLTRLPSLVQDNRRLEEEVTKLNQKLVDYDQLKTNFDLLQRELNYKQKSPFQLVTCGVLSFDTQNFTDTITISCGNDTGVEVGQAVLADGYVIAQVVYVGGSTSTALLLTGSQSSLDAKLSKNTTEGVVKGSFGSGMVFDLVSQTADVSSGDLVVTAGINPKIPKNLLIGEVGGLLSGPNDLFKKLSIVSPIKIHQLNSVFVIKP